jgi:hypothetical protein
VAGPWTKIQFVSRNNCFWQAKGEPVTLLGKTLAQWQAEGHEQGSIIADPKLSCPAKDDFRVTADSPAVRLGFKPFDASKAGVYGSADWVKKARSVCYPALEIAPPPPPLAIHDDFESAPLGHTPGGVEAHVENRGDAIVVTDETAAQGKRSVKILDAPGLRQSFNPHLVYGHLTYKDGPVVNRFALRVEQDTLLQFEWRDYTSGYATGPQFAIRGGTLSVDAKHQMKVPLGEWVAFEVRADLDAAPGRWTLNVTLPGQAPKVFDELAYANPQFHKLNWVGFTSGATKKTAFYLDDFHLARPAGVKRK